MQLLGTKLGTESSDSETAEKSNFITKVSKVGGFLKVEDTNSGSLKKEALNLNLFTAQDARCRPSGAMLLQKEELGQTGTTSRPVTLNMARCSIVASLIPGGEKQK